MVTISTTQQPAPEKLDASPDESWSLDQLAECASRSLSTSNEIEASLGLLVRRSVQSYFRAGHALLLARNKVKSEGREWCQWQDERKLARTTVFEAVMFFETAMAKGGETAITNMTLKQAKKHLGISKFKKPVKKKKPTLANAGIADLGTTVASSVPADGLAIETVTKTPLPDGMRTTFPAGQEAGLLDRLKDVLDELADLRKGINNVEANDPEYAEYMHVVIEVVHTAQSIQRRLDRQRIGQTGKPKQAT